MVCIVISSTLVDFHRRPGMVFSRSLRSNEVTCTPLVISRVPSPRPKSPFTPSLSITYRGVIASHSPRLSHSVVVVPLLCW